MAADRRFFDDRTRRIWNLSQHDRLSADDGSNDAAGAAFEKPQCSKQRSQPADACKWVQHSGGRQPHDVCRRSELPCGIRAELATLCAAGPARVASDDGDVPGFERHASDATVSAEYFSRGRLTL